MFHTTTRFTLTIVGLVLLAFVTNAVPTLGAPVDRIASSTSSNTDLLELGPGTAGVALGQSSADGATIDLTRGGTVGIPPNARYTYGNPSAPLTDYAFTLTSRIEDSPGLTIEYRGAEVVGDGIDHVSLEVFDAAGEHLTTVSEEHAGTFTPDGPGTYYVVLVVDTSGLDAASDLSGSIHVAA